MVSLWITSKAIIGIEWTIQLHYFNLISLPISFGKKPPLIMRSTAKRNK